MKYADKYTKTLTEVLLRTLKGLNDACVDYAKMMQNEETAEIGKMLFDAACDHIKAIKAELAKRGYVTA